MPREPGAAGARPARRRAQGVGETTAVLPDGWRDRLVRWSSNGTGRAQAVFLDPHDLVVAKLVAHREKDLAFATALVAAGLVDVAVRRARVAGLPSTVDARLVDAVDAFLDSL